MSEMPPPKTPAASGSGGAPQATPVAQLAATPVKGDSTPQQQVPGTLTKTPVAYKTPKAEDAPDTLTKTPAASRIPVFKTPTARTATSSPSTLRQQRLSKTPAAGATGSPKRSPRSRIPLSPSSRAQLSARRAAGAIEAASGSTAKKRHQRPAATPQRPVRPSKDNGVATPKTRRRVLEKKVSARPSPGKLVRSNILREKPSRAAPALQAKQRELAAARVRSKLTHGLKDRPSSEALERTNILRDGHSVAPALAAQRQQLKEARTRSQLDRELKKRSSLVDLMKANIVKPEGATEQESADRVAKMHALDSLLAERPSVEELQDRHILLLAEGKEAIDRNIETTGTLLKLHHVMIQEAKQRRTAYEAAGRALAQKMAAQKAGDGSGRAEGEAGYFALTDTSHAPEHTRVHLDAMAAALQRMQAALNKSRAVFDKYAHNNAGESQATAQVEAF